MALFLTSLLQIFLFSYFLSSGIDHVYVKGCDAKRCFLEQRIKRAIPPPCPAQSRWCSCQAGFICDYGQFGNWSPDVLHGECRQQTRSRKLQRQHTLYRTVYGKCEPQGTPCRAFDTQSRTLCKCRQLVKCHESQWTTWSPQVPTNTCIKQTRNRRPNPEHKWIEKLNDCSGVISDCSNNGYDDQRTYCNCHYMDCTLNNWSPWTIVKDSGSCPKEERFRRYTGQSKYKYAHVNCNSVYPQTCPSPSREQRDKAVTCPPIAAIKNANFINKECNGSSSSCGSTCQIRCALAGYDIVNARYVTCTGIGKWSGSLGYCNDTTSPIMKCPAPNSVGNLPNKNYALVGLKDPVVSDNSGENPKVTVSHTLPVKVTVGKPVRINYVAKDGNGNSAHCASEISVKDTEPPKVIFCPKSKIATVKKFPSPVIWEEPQFSDNVDSHVKRTSSHQNGQLFSRGRFHVKYVAEDASYNQVTCEFDIQVTPISCKEHPAPKHGAVSCNINKSGHKQLYLCAPQCNDGFWFLTSKEIPKVYDYYSCGDDGTWRGLDAVNGSPTDLYINVIQRDRSPWPACAKGTPPAGVKREYRILAGNCKDNSTQQTLKKNLVAQLKAHTLTKYLYCFGSEDNCAVENIKVECSSGRRRRSVTNGQLVISFVVKVENPNAVKNQTVALKELDKAKTKLASFKTELAKLVSSTTKTNVTVEDKGEKYTCKPGQVFAVVNGRNSVDQRSKCVECPVGTFHDTLVGKCTSCPIGTYQDQEAQMKCISCPKGTSTQGLNSANVTDCKAICGPGTYSDTGLATCLACPKSGYQPNHQQKTCLNCPAGLQTEQRGASSVADCTKRVLVIHIISEGCEDRKMKQCSDALASIKVNGNEHSTRKRGYNIVVVDQLSGKVDDSKNFDTHCCRKSGLELEKYITDLPDRKIVLLAIKDEGAANVNVAVVKALSSIGGHAPFQRGYRGSFAMVGYKGTGNVTWTQQVMRPRTKGPSELKVTIPI